MRKTLYLFSGLGADERAFQRLDLSGYSVVFIKWLSPKKGETIESYVTRLLNQITTPDPVLIGLSFGGMMAVEVAKQIRTERESDPDCLSKNKKRDTVLLPLGRKDLPAQTSSCKDS